MRLTRLSIVGQEGGAGKASVCFSHSGWQRLFRIPLHRVFCYCWRSSKNEYLAGWVRARFNATALYHAVTRRIAGSSRCRDFLRACFPALSFPSHHFKHRSSREDGVSPVVVVSQKLNERFGLFETRCRDYARRACAYRKTRGTFGATGIGSSHGTSGKMHHRYIRLAPFGQSGIPDTRLRARDFH